MEEELHKWFTILFGVQQALGAIIIISIASWLSYFRGPFAWTSEPKQQFNWHPLLMTIGMIYLYANSMLVYRAFRSSRKKKLKVAHAVIHALAFLVTVIGLQAVFDSHNLVQPPIPNMYSLHSWIGLSSVIMFTCQWVAGFLMFLYPTLAIRIRAAYMPVHIYFGILGFVLAVAAAGLGLTEKALFSVQEYSNLPAEGMLINIIGVLLCIFAALVVYLTTEYKFKRMPLPEDEMLLTGSGSMNE